MGKTKTGYGAARFNSQPPEGGWSALKAKELRPNSFNSQPPEGGWMRFSWIIFSKVVSTHSRPKAAGAVHSGDVDLLDVSTHSRPKAAGLSAHALIRT